MLINLDLHELYYLLESALRGSHLRSGVIERFTNEVYDKLEEIERMLIFEWSVRLCYAWHNDKPFFEPYSSCCGHDTEFMKRYHPENQYRVYTNYNRQKLIHRAFKMNGNYYIGSNTRIAPEYITKVEHINLTGQWENYKVDNVDYDTNILE